MQAPKMTYLWIYNYKNDASKGGRMCSPWTWLGQEWPWWPIWTDFGQSGATMAWRISPRWVWEILFSFDFTTFVSGWDVQPWRRLLVLRSQHGVPRRRRWCWGDPDGLSQQQSCTSSQWSHWSEWSHWSTNHIDAPLNSIHHINETRYQALPPSYVYSVASSVSSIILSLLLSNLVPKTNLAKIKMSFSQSSASWKIAAKLNTFDQILVAL